MKCGFMVCEVQCIYVYFMWMMLGVDLSQLLLQVDLYGGVVNKVECIGDIVVLQWVLIMKLQYQMYWGVVVDDVGYLWWISDFYCDVYGVFDVFVLYSGMLYFGDWYEGCYINYFDVDMFVYLFWL